MATSFWYLPVFKIHVKFLIHLLKAQNNKNLQKIILKNVQVKYSNFCKTGNHINKYSKTELFWIAKHCSEQMRLWNIKLKYKLFLSKEINQWCSDFFFFYFYIFCLKSNTVNGTRFPKLFSGLHQGLSHKTSRKIYILQIDIWEILHIKYEILYLFFSFVGDY